MIASRTKVMIAATIAVWTTAYIAWTADWFAMSFPFTGARLFGRFVMCVIGALLCGVLFQIVSRRDLRGWTSRIGTGVALTILASSVYALCHLTVFQALDRAWSPAGVGEGIRIAVGVSWIFLLWFAVYFAFQMAADAQAAQLKLAEVTAAEFKGRYQALAAQIHPHFLFNALNTVSALILDGAYGRAEKTTLSLASLLRHSLETDPATLVPLRTEIEVVRRYLDIVQVRFEERLKIVEDIPASLLKHAIPPLMLQPLVENVIRHGVSRSSGQVTLTLTAELVGDDLRLTVLDNAVADDLAEAPGAGIGQQNIAQRLALLYGERASLVCGHGADGYESVLTLPIQG